eukprot:gnl/MRDRNA2_/MRDRNA2_174414_c0_seq1.p1 gnl/MRDRNA2_/MRDRNA2_174414_c0~~gnl/MRDRNA2_/MRDRNA2_174414_c0_seq1.p1  ORF type:complete len:161 (+),score=17.64 gnl/MRDRNA2_/MRDRNA2_174414_c0_seq1:111-593(+)
MRRNKRAAPNQVDIISGQDEELLAQGCCNGEWCGFPDQLAPYLSEDEFQDGIEKVDKQTKKEDRTLCLCAFSVVLTSLAGFLWCIPWHATEYNRKRRRVPEKVLNDWVAKGLTIDYLPGKSRESRQEASHSIKGHPARIRITLPAAGNVIGKPEQVAMGP